MDARDRFEISNATDRDIPGGGLALWAGSFTDRGQLVVVAPTAAGQRNLVVVGEFMVPAGGVGIGSFDARCNVRFDPAGGPPAPGDTLGSVADSFFGAKGQPGYVCYGGVNAAGFAACVRTDDLAAFPPTVRPSPIIPPGCEWFTALDKYASCLYAEIISKGGACDCPPLPPPPVASWNCVDGFCVDPLDGVGRYPTLAACLAAERDCTSPPPPPPPPPVSYNCTAGLCIAVSGTGGTYATLAECVAAGCAVPPVSYNCVSGVCTDPGDGTGIYPTLAACVALLCSPPPTTWRCPDVPGGACVSVPDLSGPYATYVACATACTTGGGSQVCCPLAPRMSSGNMFVSQQTGGCTGFITPVGDTTYTDLGAAGCTSVFTLSNGYVVTFGCNGSGAWYCTMTGGGRTVSAASLVVDCRPGVPNMTFTFRFDLSAAAGDACTGYVFGSGYLFS